MAKIILPDGDIELNESYVLAIPKDHTGSHRLGSRFNFTKEILQAMMFCATHTNKIDSFSINAYDENTCREDYPHYIYGVKNITFAQIRPGNYRLVIEDCYRAKDGEPFYLSDNRDGAKYISLYFGEKELDVILGFYHGEEE